MAMVQTHFMKSYSTQNSYEQRYSHITYNNFITENIMN